MLDKNIIETYLSECIKSECASIEHDETAKYAGITKDVLPEVKHGDTSNRALPMAEYDNTTKHADTANRALPAVKHVSTAKHDGIAKHADTTNRALPVVELYDRLGSTNERCKDICKEISKDICKNIPEDIPKNVRMDIKHDAFQEYLVIAKEQSAGRGRQGRQFFSPKNTGIYFSLLIFPDKTLDAGVLMAQTALCVCDVCEEFCFQDCFQDKQLLKIKWPNDIYYKNKKVAGILIETVQSKNIKNNGSKNNDARNNNESKDKKRHKNNLYYIIGIGINVFEPADGWPAELQKNGACPNALLSAQAKDEMPDLCNKLIAHIASRLFAFCHSDKLNKTKYNNDEHHTGVNDKDKHYNGEHLTSISNSDEQHASSKALRDNNDAGILSDDSRYAKNSNAKNQLLKAYNERFMLAGKQVEIQRGNEQFSCTVLGVDDNFCLRVRTQDNIERTLSSGEIHLKL